MKPTSGKKSFDGEKHLINYKAHLKVVFTYSHTYKIGGNERALLGFADSENHFDLVTYNWALKLLLLLSHFRLACLLLIL